MSRKGRQPSPVKASSIRAGPLNPGPVCRQGPPDRILAILCTLTFWLVDCRRNLGPSSLARQLGIPAGPHLLSPLGCLGFSFLLSMRIKERSQVPIGLSTASIVTTGGDRSNPQRPAGLRSTWISRIYSTMLSKEPLHAPAQ